MSNADDSGGAAISSVHIKHPATQSPEMFPDDFSSSATKRPKILSDLLLVLV